MLHLLDFIIIFVYIIITVTIGILSRGKQDSAEDYFTTSGQMGGFFQSLLVGLSIAATLFSGISFLAYPSVIYTHGIGIMLGIVCFPIAWAVLRFSFLPRYLKNSGQPYDVIEKKLGKNIRTLSAIMFSLLRIGWMAALIYAPTVAIMAAAGLGDIWFWPIVLIIGLSSTLYTTMGGIRGVIVTDAVQFIVIIIGITFTVGFVIFNMHVDFSQVMQMLSDKGHLKLINPSFDFTTPFTAWSILIGFTLANFSSYMADQMSLQRYIAAGNLKSASRSFGINVFGVILVLLLLAGVGLSLVVWYHFNPDPNLPESTDKIFPYFVATQLPAGIAGLILAAIIAATMSSMTSGINALAGTLTIDLRGRFSKKKLSPKQELKFSKTCSLVIGVCATLFAGLVSHLGSIFDIAQTLLGVFLGPLLACIIFAVYPLNVNRHLLTVGMIAGSIAGWLVAISPATSLWITPAAFTLAFIFPLITTWTINQIKQK